jgi:hypothetical protein
MGDDGAVALAAGRFPKLKTIAVEKCFLSDVGIAALKRVATVTGDDNQNDDEEDPDDRYISGRE